MDLNYPFNCLNIDNWEVSSVLNEFGKRVFKNGDEGKLPEFLVGLEVERERIDGDGQISQFPYPKNIGDQQTNPWITNDFMQTMAEVVTPVANTSRQALRYLEQLSNILRCGLAESEYLWPLSMPPALPANRTQVDIAHAKPEKRDYFFTWLKSHPLEEATPCGLHVNLGINPTLASALSVEEKNQLYISIAQGFLHYRFVLTYLFGASPLAEKNYFLHHEGPKKLVRSIRQSKHGFGTKFDGDFTDVEHYSQRILEGVKNGQLLAEHDFHSPVRLRGPKSVAQLPSQGADYIELRMLDLNPWASVGLSSDELDLMRLMAAYFLATTRDKFDLQISNQFNEEVALESPLSISHYQDQIQEFLVQLDDFAATIQSGQETYELLDRLQKIVAHPEMTTSGRLVSHVQNCSLRKFAVNQAVKFQERSQKAANVYQGFKSGQKLTSQELKAILK